jgi:hypothetical protein
MGVQNYSKSTARYRDGDIKPRNNEPRQYEVEEHPENLAKDLYPRSEGGAINPMVDSDKAGGARDETSSNDVFGPSEESNTDKNSRQDNYAAPEYGQGAESVHDDEDI